MSFLHANNIAIHYRLDDVGEGPPIVFSNSLGTDFRIWDDLIALLRANGLNNPILCYDKRGHGLSEATSQPFKMSDHVDDLAALMDHLELRGAIIFGLSVGGLIAQGLFSVRRELVSALVLSDTAHKIGDDALWNMRIEAVNKDGIQSLAKGILERWFSREFRESGGAAFAGYANMLVRTPVDGYAGTSAAIRDCDFTDVARSIDVPTLLICGSNDGATTPQLMQKTHELIVGSRYEIIDGPGHLPNLEAPEKVAEIFLDFYRSL